MRVPGGILERGEQSVCAAGPMGYSEPGCPEAQGGDSRPKPQWLLSSMPKRSAVLAHGGGAASSAASCASM
eukprot:9638718-Heterocapsa_arctica.AAC.1